MKTNRMIAILVAALLVASLAACKRPIPGTADNPTATPVEGSSLPGSPTDVLGQIYLFATQTSMATQGLTSLETPVPNSASPTPAPGEPGAPIEVAPTEAVVPPPEPAAPEPIVAPTATPGRPGSYTLRTGEFPYCIARRFDVDPGALLRANGLTSYSVYFAGMTLQIPSSAGGFPGNRALRSHPTTYTVRPGDTLFTIACAFGDVDPNMIAYVNNINLNTKLTPGEVIHIP